MPEPEINIEFYFELTQALRRLILRFYVCFFPGEDDEARLTSKLNTMKQQEVVHASPKFFNAASELNQYQLEYHAYLRVLNEDVFPRIKADKDDFFILLFSANSHSGIHEKNCGLRYNQPDSALWRLL